ncbi:MAG: glycosyltransferase family 4 protein [Pseudomonadota bacterium]
MTAIQPAILVPRYWPAMGGAEQHSRALVHAMPEDIQPIVAKICSDSPHPTDTAYAFGTAGRMKDNGVETHTLAPSAAAGVALRTLARHVEDNRYGRGAFRKIAQWALSVNLRRGFAESDLNHVIYNGCTPLADAAANSAKPFVFTPLAHTTKREGTAWSSPGFKRLYKRANAVIAMTEYERQWLIDRGAREETTHVVPMAPLLDETVTPDEADFRARHQIGDAPIVLFLGRMADSKGYQAILDAGHDVWREHPNTCFVFIGPGTEESEAAFKASEDNPRVIHLGLVDEQEKQSALAAATMVCVPSTEESLGVVYLEAWRFSKPVIAARTPVMSSVIDEGDDGLLTDPVGWKVAKAITSLLNAPIMAAAMGEHGHAKVHARYTWEGSAARLAKIYRQVLGR